MVSMLYYALNLKYLNNIYKIKNIFKKILFYYNFFFDKWLINSLE